MVWPERGDHGAAFELSPSRAIDLGFFGDGDDALADRGFPMALDP